MPQYIEYYFSNLRFRSLSSLCLQLARVQEYQTLFNIALEGRGGTQWGMQLPNHNKLVTLFGAMMISMNYINLPVVSCYVNFPQVDPLIDDVLIFQRCSSWNLRKGIRLKKKMVCIFKIYSLQKCKSYQSINLHLLWGKLDYYNIAHVLALYKSYWAAMNKIFIYAACA